MDNVKVIFDNGGGITLQLGDWACWYNVPKDAARDYFQYLQDKTTDGWEGHNDDAAELDPSCNEINNGGYRVYSVSDINDECNSDDSSWGNIDDFCLAVIDLNKVVRLQDLKSWLSAGQVAEKYKISRQNVLQACIRGRFDSGEAVETSLGWLISPEGAERLWTLR